MGITGRAMAGLYVGILVVLASLLTLPAGAAGASAVGGTPTLLADWPLDEVNVTISGPKMRVPAAPTRTARGAAVFRSTPDVHGSCDAFVKTDHDIDRVPGRFGTALEFDHTFQVGEVRCASQGILAPQELTVMAWVQAPHTPGPSYYLIAKGAGGLGPCIPAAWGMYTSFAGDVNQGGLYFYVTHEGQGYHAPGIPASALWDGNWHMVAGTFDGSTARFFLDGVQVGNGVAVPGPITYSQPLSYFTIGGYTTQSLNQACAPYARDFVGKMDEVRIYNGALDAAEIQRIAAYDGPGRPPALVPGAPPPPAPATPPPPASTPPPPPATTPPPAPPPTTPPQPPSAPAAGRAYQLRLSVSHCVVPVENGVAQISCGKGLGKIGPSFAVGGGVVGGDRYALRSTHPVYDAQGRPTGWAGRVVGLPGFQVDPGMTLLTEVGLRESTLWHHRHHVLLPAGFLRLRQARSSPSTLPMYVVCARFVAESASAVTRGYQLRLSVSQRVVPVENGVAQISCGKGLGKIGPSYAVGGGVVAGDGYAVRATYPVFDAQDRPTGWAGRVSLLPRYRLDPGMTLLTDAGLFGSFWHHRHHVALPAGFLRLGRQLPSSPSTLPMYVVCERLVAESASAPAATRGYRLTLLVSHRVVRVERDVAQISCPKGLGKIEIGSSFAVGGGVVAGDRYAVRATYPVFDAQGRPTGWAGKVVGLPGFQLDPGMTLLTDVGNHGTFWHHHHHVALPAGFLRLGRQAPSSPSTLPMDVVCARLVESAT